MTDNPEGPRDDGVRRLFGYVLSAIGGLIFATSGLCTVTFIGSTASNHLGDLVPIALLFGGVPMAIGLGLIAAGRRLLRPATRRPRPPAARAPLHQDPPTQSPWTRRDPP